MEKTSRSTILRCASLPQRTSKGIPVLSGLFFVAALMLIMLPFDASAATFTVNSTADMPDFHPGDGACNAKPASKSVRPVCTLRAAIMEANALGGANTIILKPGIYAIAIPGQDEDAGTSGDLDISSDLTITGLGASKTIIDGGGLDRVFDIHSGVVKISGVTIRNGNPGDINSGGGIHNSATLTLTNSIISGNTAPVHGGGIFNEGMMTVINSIISNNSAFYSGGGIRIEGSSSLISNSVITGNRACDGIGISIEYTSPVIQGNSITKNLQDFCSGGIGGGGISMLGNSTAQILNNIISDNFLESTNGGGGITLFSAGAPTIKDNIIRRNTATGTFPCSQGGGIWIVNESDASIIQNVITENQTGCGGGIAAFIQSGAPLIINNTIADNDSTQGSGVFADWLDAQTEFVNNIIVAKLGQTAVFCGDFNDINPPIFRFNNVFGPSGVAYGGICSDQTGINGNISANPLFVNPLAGDYELLPGSPAIDAGDNTVCPTADQRGVARPQDGNGDGIAVCDIGAFEVAARTFSISGTVRTMFGTPVSGVTISLTGAATKTTTTSAIGTYTFAGLVTGTYTITPQSTRYTFIPASRTVALSGANITGQNFVAK